MMSTESRQASAFKYFPGANGQNAAVYTAVNGVDHVSFD